MSKWTLRGLSEGIKHVNFTWNEEGKKLKRGWRLKGEEV